MKILLLNDDGYDAAGLNCLIAALKDEHQLYLCAPKRHMSGMGHAISVGRHIAVQKTDIAGVKVAYVVDGTPCDCAKLAHLYLFKDIDFDLVISGINCGLNLAVDIVYSGTVSAAHESWGYGYNALALSQDIAADVDQTNFEAAAQHAKNLIEQIEFSEKPFLYSVNYPTNCRPKGLIYASASEVTYREAIDLNGDSARFTIKLTGHRNNLSSADDNEYDLIKKGYATIYPVYIEVYPSQRDGRLATLIDESL